MRKINFPEVVLRGMRRKKLRPTGYQLAKLVKGKITIASCDKFLKGRSSMRSDNLALVLSALGARVTYQKSNYTQDGARHLNIGGDPDFDED